MTFLAFAYESQGSTAHNSDAEVVERRSTLGDTRYTFGTMPTSYQYTLRLRSGQARSAEQRLFGRVHAPRLHRPRPQFRAPIAVHRHPFARRLPNRRTVAMALSSRGPPPSPRRRGGGTVAGVGGHGRGQHPRVCHHDSCSSQSATSAKT